MTQNATSTLVLADGGIPAAKQAHPRITHLFKGRVPEFAHAQWLAVQRSTSTDSPSPVLSPSRIHTYAVMEDGMPVVLVFFQVEKNAALVLNEALQETGEELRNFSRHVFQHFPAARRICFFSQQRFIQAKGKKHSRHPEYRLRLPRHPSVRMEEALRFSHRNVKYFLQRLKHDHPDFSIECHASDADIASYCRALLQLHRPQSADKKSAGLPLDEAGEKLVRAAQETGMVCVLKIGGRIAAGSICLQIGGNWQLHFLAHDPRFQAYGLGMLCCYFTACEHIDRQRNKSGVTINRPRVTHALTVGEERTAALTLSRPHASWLVRCDHAIYSVCMDTAHQLVQWRNDALQLWQSTIRLALAVWLALKIIKKRLAALPRLLSPATLLRLIKAKALPLTPQRSR